MNEPSAAATNEVSLLANASADETETHDMTPDERDALERRANEVRSRLLETVERLDQKRHEIVEMADVKGQIEHHVVPIAAAAAFGMLAVGAMSGIAAVHAYMSPQRKAHDRKKALLRAWQHPNRVGRTRSFAAETARTVLSGIVTTLALEVVKRAAEEFSRAKKAPVKRRAPIAVAVAGRAVANVASGVSQSDFPASPSVRPI